MKNKVLLLCAVSTLIIGSIFINVIKNKGDRTNYLDKVESVTIYLIDTQTAMNYDRKKLSETGLSTIYNPKDYFSKITYKDEIVIWKGDKFGIIHMKDGSELKIRVSNYGELFSIIGEDGYYTYEKS